MIVVGVYILSIFRRCFSPEGNDSASDSFICYTNRRILKKNQRTDFEKISSFSFLCVYCCNVEFCNVCTQVLYPKVNLFIWWIFFFSKNEAYYDTLKP